MRIFLALSVIIISLHYGRCKIDLKRDKEVIIDIDSPELHQSQYHTADFDTSAYNYGYAVEPNGQFHHETRGGDGVTYGCYGYIDSDDLLKVTHYVADSQGYRTLEHEKPVLVYPVNENNVDADEKPKGVMLDWKDLYFPIGCGMAKGGVLLNTPVIRAPGGIFQQLGETKFPVQPSAEPKVVVPRIPFNGPMKTEPTKLTPVSTVVSTYTKQQNPKTTTSVTFSSPADENHSKRTTTQRPTINISTPTKQANGNAHGPENDTKISYRQSQQSTVQTTASPSSQPTRPRTSASTFGVSVNNGPSTVETPSKKLTSEKVTPSFGPSGQSDYTEDLLPPFHTTNNFNVHTTIGLPINSVHPGNDFDVINSYANIHPDAPTTTEPSFVGEITTVVPIQSHPFSNSYNNNGPSTVASTKYPATHSTQKVSSIRPNNFGAFTTFNTQTTTATPFDLATESNADSTNPDSSTIYTDAESLPTPADEWSTPHQRPVDISHQTSTKYSSSRPDLPSSTFGVSSSIASRRPSFDTVTTTNIDVEYETTTSQSTYPGIGDYSKPQAGFEFNIPTRAPSQASTPKVQTYVTVSSVEPLKPNVKPQNVVDVNSVENKPPSIYDKTFTNGPHGAEYQLGSRNPHPQYRFSNDNLDFLNPIKQSRNDADPKNPPISLITPLTHLTISGSFPSKPNDTTDPSSAQQPSTPNNSNRSPTYENQYSVSEVINSHRPSTVQSDRESSRPNQPSGFFTVTTPKSEPTRGIITHMNAISNTRFQSNRVTPSVTPIDEQNTNNVISNQPDDFFQPEGQKNIRPDSVHKTHPERVRPTEYPFLYTRSRTTLLANADTPYQGESGPGSLSPNLITNAPSDELTTHSGFGPKIIPGVNPATTSYTAYFPGSTSKPSSEVEDGVPPTNRLKDNPVPHDNLPYQPKFVLRPTVRPASNSNRQPLSTFNGYPDAYNRNANLYPDSTTQKAGDNNPNNIQPESKYVNTKKEFIPQYNPGSTPIPGSLGTAIGVYPPNVGELVPEIPNFSIAISKWPFYILPFPFANANLMTFPFLGGMPIQLGGVNVPGDINQNAGPTSGSDYAQGGIVGSSGNGPPAQTICSWLNSFIKARENATKTETPTNENGETLQISNLQVNVKNPQLQVNQQMPFGIVGFIPVIAVPNCQHNAQGDKVDANALPSSIQLPNLCTQLSHLLGNPSVTSKDTDQPSSAT